MLPHTGLFLLGKVALQMRIRRCFKERGSQAFRQIKMPPLPTFRHALPAASALRARCTEKIQVRTNNNRIG
ncbi:hypothetical protein GQF38_09105 [Neisseria meningitidis]|nr:hypothetical protein [Neisseria meningitidis]